MEYRSTTGKQSRTRTSVATNFLNFEDPRMSGSRWEADEEFAEERNTTATRYAGSPEDS